MYSSMHHSSDLEPADLDSYRSELQAWLAANLSPLPAGGAPTPHYTRAYIDEQRRLQRTLYEAGYAGIAWPKEYGGQGLTKAHQAIFTEESARYVLPDFGQAAITTGTCAKTLRDHASEEFKREHLPRIFSGEEVWVQFLSEPGAGSDLASVQLRATRDGDVWVLNGSKVWTTFAHLADWGLCIARTDWEVPKHQGLTWFALSTKAPGLMIRPIRQIMGDSDFCEEFFDDVAVPDGDRVGAVNGGWAVTTTLLTYERGAEREGARDGGLEAPDGPGPLAPDLVALARRMGREKDPLVRQAIARAHGNDYIVAELNQRVATAMAQNPAGAAMASYVKLARGIFQPLRAMAGLRIGRGTGITWPQDQPQDDAARAFLAGRHVSIAAGTNEMQRNGIAERILGLPREPAVDRDKPFSQVLRDARNWSAVPPLPT